MTQSRRIAIRVAMTAALLAPAAAWAQAPAPPVSPPPTGCKAPPRDVVVLFGAFNNAVPPKPLALDPDEATIQPGGTVTFQMVSRGHTIAIYPVSPDTTRDTIDAQIAQIAAGASTTLIDKKGNTIIDFAKDPAAGYIPVNRVALGIGPQDLTTGLPGGLAGPKAAVPPAVPPVVVNLEKPGTSLQYRFPTIGRYLVICAMKSHFNGHMYGFVEVADCVPQAPPNTPPSVP